MSTGREIKAAFKKAATWGEAVACAQDDMILITSESISRSREQLLDDSAGHAFQSNSDQGFITCSGDINAYLRYTGLETLLAMVMGSAGTPSDNGDGSYTHSLSMADHTDGLFGTLALYKGFSVHEFAGAKLTGFSLSGQAGQPLSLGLNLLCDDRVINTTSGTNTTTVMAALESPSPAGRVLFRHGSFRINDQGGAALDSANEIQPSGFTLSVSRNLSGDHLAGGGDTISEPTATGFPSVSLSLDFPVYTSDVFLSDLGADTRKKMLISFTSGDNVITLSMPHLALTNAEASINGAGKITQPVSAAMLAAASAPAGMDGVTAPLHMSITNTLSSDPLA